MTIKDVARALNVSTTTVSRALSGKGRIGEETARRVREYIQEHNYVPNAIAQSLADQKTYNIGVILPEMDAMDCHAFFCSCVAGVCQEVSATPYDVLTIVDDDSSTGKLARALERKKLDGAIVSRAHVEGKAASRLRQAGVPFVLVGFSPDKTVCQIDHDHQSACAELTRHLLRGGRRLALIGGELNLYVVQDRLQGFMTACREAGVHVPDELLHMGVDSPEQAQAALNAALAAGADCLVCMDDRICGMVLSLLHHKGLKIPQDIQAASFYDSSLLQSYTPPITALQFDAQKLGAEACRLLLTQMEGRAVSMAEKIDYSIALRASTEA